MKKFVLAAIAAMTLGMGVASAQTTNADFLGDLQHPHLPSAPYSYSPPNG
jgi:hypothetical protein